MENQETLNDIFDLSAQYLETCTSNQVQVLKKTFQKFVCDANMSLSVLEANVSLSVCEANMSFSGCEANVSLLGCEANIS